MVAVVGNKVHAEDEQGYRHFGKVNNKPCVEHESLLEFLQNNTEPVCVMFAIVEEEKRYPCIDMYSKMFIASFIRFIFVSLNCFSCVFI